MLLFDDITCPESEFQIDTILFSQKEAHDKFNKFDVCLFIWCSLFTETSNVLLSDGKSLDDVGLIKETEIKIK